MPSVADDVQATSLWSVTKHASLEPYISILGLTIALPFARFVLEKLVFKHIAGHCIPPALKPLQAQPRKHQQQQLQAKFCESLWKALAYSSTFLLGLHAISNEPWFGDTSHFWDGWPQQHFSSRLLLLFKAYFAAYASGLWMLIFWDAHKSDYRAMVVHHVATLVLTALAYKIGYLRAASLTMVLHDPSDILLEVTKMLSYAKWQKVSTVMFVVFMASWFFTRLVYFPFWVVWSTSIEVRQLLGYTPPLYHLFNSLMLLLVVLHVYWFAIICKIAVKALQGKDMEDTRED